jgi:hypothetical protein
VLTDLLPVALAMMAAKVTGKFNFTNPGTISHNECLELYKKHVDPTFWWVTILNVRRLFLNPIPVQV